MAFRSVKNAEPIAGYQLLDRLGSGGYGEVWRATAPGGLTKAVKIVYGAVGDSRAVQELKALTRIKEVRHPFLLSLERFEIIEDQLVIVTELADKSLLDRYNECRKAGLPGIPRDELLIYLRDAAEALDYMGETYGLQHLDIKPQNLLLVGGRIKVADFGMVKDMQGTSVTATGGVTPIYATPEAFDGRVSRFSDQYSLAIVYQEMLTGIRPFPGTTTMQLSIQHTRGRPLLDPLPAHDRSVVARALSKVPEQRYPTCREMVSHLLDSRPSSASPPPVSPPPLAKAPSTGNVSPAPAPEDDSGAPTNVATSVGDQSSSQKVAPPVLEPGFEATALPMQSRESVPSLAEAKAGLRPTLFLGIGGLAGTVLCRLKQRLQHRFGNLAAVPIYRLLLVDTDRAALRRARDEAPGEALAIEETLLTPLQAPEHYRADAKKLLRWLQRCWLYGIPRSLLTEGVRPLGRLALVDNAASILDHVREALTQLSSAEAAATAVGITGQHLREEMPRVFVVASITGGTGSGMLLGMAYAIQQVLTELRLPADSVCGLLVHATSPKPAEKEAARLNAYATLRELNHFMRPDKAYPGDPAHRLAAFRPGSAPFQECYLVQLGEGLSKAEATSAADLVAEYLYLDADPICGSFLDQYRHSSHTSSSEPGDEATLRTFGLYQIHFPRHELADLAALLFCRQLVERWPGGLSGPEKEQTESEAQAQANTVGLDLESLVKRFHAAATTLLGEDPEAYCSRLLTSCLPSPEGPAQPSAHGELSEKILGTIDALLGPGRDLDESMDLGTTPLETTLSGQAGEVGNSVSRSVMEWLLDVVEDPARRFAGADWAARWLAEHLRGLAANARTRLVQLRTQRTAFRQRLIADDRPGKGGVSAWLALGRRQETARPLRLKFLEYYQLRLLEIALENTVIVVGKVYREVSTFLQDLVLCRKKLNQFLQMFRLGLAPGDSSADETAGTANQTEVLPGQARDLAQAAAAIVEDMPPDLHRQFDADFQAEVLNPQGGLWSLVGSGEANSAQREEQRATSSLAFWDLVSRDNNLAELLRKELLNRARALILRSLKSVDAAQLFLESRPDPEEAVHAVTTCLEAARPRLLVPGGWEHLVLAVPGSSAGTGLWELVAQALPEVPITALESKEDAVLCYEGAHLPLRQLAETLVGDEAGLVDLSARIMTMADVDWSRLNPVAR